MSVVLTPRARLLQRLRGKNVLAQVRRGASADLTYRLGTRALARWACNTAARPMSEILAPVPESVLKTQLDAWYFGIHQE